MDNRIRELEQSLASMLGYLPDLRVPTTILVVIAVLTWMFFTARRDLQIRRPLKQRLAERMHRPRTVRTVSQQRRNTMTRTPSSTGSPGLTIRWGRTTIFLISAAALLTFLVTGIASAFGAPTAAAAGVALLVTVAGLVSLRVLAVREQRRRRAERVERAFDDAVNGTDVQRATSATPSVEHGGHPETSEVFDAQPEIVPHPVQHEHGDEQPAERQEAEAQPAEPEQPVLPKVPKPVYLEAGEVSRTTPEPLQPQSEPTPSPGVQLKDGVSAEYAAEVQAKANRRLDLDKVLERRRAI